VGAGEKNFGFIPGLSPGVLHRETMQTLHRDHGVPIGTDTREHASGTDLDLNSPGWSFHGARIIRL
jgi:hypothetical protein